VRGRSAVIVPYFSQCGIQGQKSGGCMQEKRGTAAEDVVKKYQTTPLRRAK
jgi:hypothetical protein